MGAALQRPWGGFGGVVAAEALRSWQPFAARLAGRGWHREAPLREVRQGAQCHTASTTSRAPQGAPPAPRASRLAHLPGRAESSRDPACHAQGLHGWRHKGSRSLGVEAGPGAGLPWVGGPRCHHFGLREGLWLLTPGSARAWTGGLLWEDGTPTSHLLGLLCVGGSSKGNKQV